MELLVGIGEYQLGQSTGKIITRGLGSCVGVTLWDELSRVGGLAHIMLPSSEDFSSFNNPNKFADLALPALCRDLRHRVGGRRLALRAKLAGGAKMFAFKSDRPGFDIGQRNVLVIREILSALSIPVVADDTGGNYGRTMILDLSSGKVVVRAVGKGEMML
jgi:chemotaxis protein CheD